MPKWLVTFADGRSCTVSADDLLCDNNGVLDFNERLEVPKERFSTVALFARGTWTEVLADGRPDRVDSAAA
jgi:hypothetical protein